VREDVTEPATTDQSTCLVRVEHKVVLVTRFLERLLASVVALFATALVLDLLLQHKK
jgi:hypothetical protein